MLTLQNSILLRTPLQSLSLAYSHFKPDNPLFKEGLYLASKEFITELEKNQNSEDKKIKLNLKYNSYWIRSCTRCTPFGTFAGVASVDLVDQETNLLLSNCEEHTRRIRLDMSILHEIIAHLNKVPEIKKQIKFRLNNSVYLLTNEYRYIAYRLKNGVRNYYLNSIISMPVLDQLVSIMLVGATYEDLLEVILKYPFESQITIDEAQMFINELLDAQFVESELEPCLTGEAPIDFLIKKITGITGIGYIQKSLVEIKKILENPTVHNTHYEMASRELENILADTTKYKNIFQTDLFLSLKSNCINKKAVNKLVSQCEKLLSFFAPEHNAELEEFKKTFLKRYDEQEIPLIEALDSDLGIGYGRSKEGVSGQNDMIDDLRIPSNTAYQHSVTIIQEIIQEKYERYLHNQSGCQYLQIEDGDIERVEKNIINSALPKSLFLYGSFLKKSSQEDDASLTLVLNHFAGPSGANLLGRFAYGCESIEQMTKDSVSVEENQECIFAEIVHMPHPRVANILLRPLIRKFEIPYGGISGMPLENQIDISDLLVTVKGNEIILFSRKHKKRVIPRLTSAHNYSYNSIPIYKFLCDLQQQNLRCKFVLELGPFLSNFKYIPRIVYKDIVLRKASWKISKQDFENLSTDPAKNNKHIRDFCLKLGIPNRLTYSDGDNEMLIHLDNELGIELLMNKLKTSATLILEEFLPRDETCIVRDAHNNPFTNEVIIPLNYEKGFTYSAYSGSKMESIKRKFPPSSEWLYFKIYCGTKFCDDFLIKHIHPFVEDALKNKLFEKFFFLRYRDDASHLRIRFYNSDVNQQTILQQIFMKSMQDALNSGFVSKITIDTYHREVERYTSELIQESETIFFNDSICIIRILNQTLEIKFNRIILALKIIDAFLNDFNMSLTGKHTLVERIQKAYFDEFGGSLELQKQLNQKYRFNQAEIFSVMNSKNDIKNGLYYVSESLKIRSSNNYKTVCTLLLATKNQGYLLDNLISSYLHMTMCRLFLNLVRKHELVVYHFLTKYYSSLRAIEKAEQ